MAVALGVGAVATFATTPRTLAPTTDSTLPPRPWRSSSLIEAGSTLTPHSASHGATLTLISGVVLVPVLV